MVSRHSKHEASTHPRIPVIDAQTLPPNARKVLAAAHKLLRKKGLQAVTLDAVATESGLNRAATRYYFGGKEGLLMAVLDAIVVEECLTLTVREPGQTRIESFDQLTDSVHDLVARRGSWTGFFDMYPWAIRHRAPSERLILLYELWFQWILDWLGVEAGDVDKLPETMKGLPEIIAAVIDGLALQAALYEERFDVERVLVTFRAVMESLVAMSSPGELPSEPPTPLP